LRDNPIVDLLFGPVNRAAANWRKFLGSWPTAVLRSFTNPSSQGIRTSCGTEGRYVVVSAVTEEPEAPSVDLRLIDIELISDSTETALSMQQGTSTRVEIDAATTRIIGHLRLLLSEDLGADKDPTVAELFSKSYHLLDLTRRPTEKTPAFGAFIYLRDVASLTRRLLWVYAQGVGADVS
jgi:hypothetical protein